MRRPKREFRRRQKHLGKYGSAESKAGFEEAIADWKAQSDESATANTTVAHLCFAYLNHVKTLNRRKRP